MILDRQHIWLTTFFFSETGGGSKQESKQYAPDRGSGETVTCSAEVDQPVTWYRVRTGKKIKSGNKFQLNGLALKFTNVQLDDAGTYECRGKSKRQYLTIYVNGEFSSCTFCSSFQHHLFFHLTIMLSCCS